MEPRTAPQDDLFGEDYGRGRPCVRDSPTSVMAAERKRNVWTDRRRVITLLDKLGTMGATDEEMQNILKMNENSQRPRRVSMAKEKVGFIVNSGRTRATERHREATVWIITPKGAAYVRNGCRQPVSEAVSGSSDER